MNWDKGTKVQTATKKKKMTKTTLFGGMCLAHFVELYCLKNRHFYVLHVFYFFQNASVYMNPQCGVQIQSTIDKYDIIFT